MFLLTAARVERIRVGRKPRKLLIKALRLRVKHRRKVLRLRVKALKSSNQQPKALKRLLGRLTSAFPTR